VTETNENFTQQHQNVRQENGIPYGDLPEFVDYEYLRKNAALNLAAFANLALAPAAPGKVGVLTSELTNRTSLQWEAPGEGQKAGGLLRAHARNHQPRLDEADIRKRPQGDAAVLEGQLPVRRAVGGCGRPRKPGGNSRAGEVEAMK
jgi:hypothetical protein